MARLYYRVASLAFDRIYVHTEEARGALVGRGVVPSDKIRVLPLGTFDFPERKDRGAELEARHGFAGKRVVLFFGFIHVVKGIDHLVRAAGEIFCRRPALRGEVLFVVAGAVRRRRGVMRLFERSDHEYHRRLLRLRDELGLADDVRFLGYVEEPMVYSLLSRADVVVVPYTTAEQSSLLVMALALGKPAVASDLGGHRELLHEIGGLVPVGRVDLYATEILRLLEDPGHHDRVSAAYRSIAERDSTPQVTARLADDLRVLGAQA
jgi:glycosyltransferase involved in cell wall biosynthesis